MKTKIPQHQDTSENSPTALERFIFNNEPAGSEETKAFRQQISDVVEEAKKQERAAILILVEEFMGQPYQNIRNYWLKKVISKIKERN